MTPDELAQLLDVEHRWAFRAKTVVIAGKEVGQTECNDYLGVFAAARGVKIPGGYTANQLVQWLADQAAAGTDGWKELGTPLEVSEYAGRHEEYFTCAAMAEEGHGHVAPVLASTSPGIIRCSAAGGTCFNATELVHSFGLRSPGVIRFFTRPRPTT